MLRGDECLWDVTSVECVSVSFPSIQTDYRGILAAPSRAAASPTGLTSLGITQNLFLTFSSLRPALVVDGLVLATVLLPQRRGRGPGSHQRNPPPLGGS